LGGLEHNHSTLSATLNVLVVEDFPPLRQAISSLLDGIGVAVIGEASDGVEAVRLSQELRPYLILLDVGLPGLHGLDAGRRIRELCPNSKILFVSQESSVDVVRAALALGAEGYVYKSCIHSDLLSAIEAVLKGKQFVSPSLCFDDAKVQLPLRHDILFCSDEAAIVDNVARFIATALNASNPAVVWATEARRESLLRELRTQGTETDTAIQNGTLMLLDVDDPPDRSLEVLMQLRDAAFRMGRTRPRVAVCGERAGNLWAQGRTDEAVRVEKLWNDLTRSHDLNILCLYPRPENDAALESICAEHTHVYSLP
jgi:DNA-binding NarL/FixJ family response regulator